MFDELQAVTATNEAATVEAKPVSKAKETRTWAWGRTHEPYDWMDAHTPSDDLSPWQ